MFNDFFLGTEVSQRWGFLALIGVGMIPILGLCVIDLLRTLRSRFSHADSLVFAPLLAFGAFVLLASGMAYQGHHLLDTFRVPARALAFAALSLLLFVLVSVRDWSDRRRTFLFWMMLLSVLQVSLVLSRIRPEGGKWWLDNSGTEEVSTYLQERDANSVWLQMPDGDMLIHIAVNLKGIGVPNAYYGDMGQKVVSSGENCGFSFEYILLPKGNLPDTVRLESDVPARQVEGPSEIDSQKLRLLRDFAIEDKVWSLYEVHCADTNNTVPLASQAALVLYAHSREYERGVACRLECG
jgi:hypothetical protein